LLDGLQELFDHGLRHQRRHCDLIEIVEHANKEVD
jgi:hypothetical protein